ncbi:MAG: hypothetical protein L3J91_02320, partial [Thermoplasmata archaeon]|nr:hypothetical protein [Thermoplasmata archaeon]
PDDWTQNDAYSGGSANACMAQFANATVDNDTYLAASDSNPADLTSYYSNMTSIMYNNYSEIWLVVPTSFAVYSTNLQGVVQNPMGSAEPYAIELSSQWLN